MSKSGSLVARLEAEALRYGFLRTTGQGLDRHKTGWEVRCGKCPKIFIAYWSPAVPTEQMVKNMRKRHWDVGQGMRPLCPDCAHAKNKAPNKRPEHQNFKMWEPPLPKTLIAATLLDAGVTLASKEVAPTVPFEQWVATQSIEPAPSTLILDQAELGARVIKRGELLEHLADAVAARNGAKAKLREAQIACAAHARKIKADRDAARQAHKADAKIQEAIRIREIAGRVKNTPAPEPEMITHPDLKITHTVFQLLDSVFDRNKRLYRSGYSDQRVAKDSGTTEEVVAKLRIEVYGELAEDPRIQSIKDDITLLEMQFADLTKNFNSSIRDLHSRVDQLRTSLAR